MEKLTIPLHSNGGYELLQSVKSSKGISQSKVRDLFAGIPALGISPAAGFSKYKTKTEEDKKSRYNSSVNLRKAGESVIEHSVNTFESKGLLGRPRKFDFVVPQHRRAKVEEKIVDLVGEAEKADRSKLEEPMKRSAVIKLNYTQNKDVRVPYPLDIDDLPVNREEANGQNTPEGGQSVLGTREIENTFTKVFSQMKTDGLKLLTISMK